MKYDSDQLQQMKEDSEFERLWALGIDMLESLGREERILAHQARVQKDLAELERQPQVPEGMKYCPKCKSVEFLDKFTKDASKEDGLCSQCKDCRNAYYKQYRRNNREKLRIQQKKYKEKKRQERCQ